MKTTPLLTTALSLIICSISAASAETEQTTNSDSKQTSDAIAIHLTTTYSYTLSTPTQQKFLSPIKDSSFNFNDLPSTSSGSYNKPSTDNK